MSCVKDVYKALAPKLGSKDLTIVFHDDTDNLGNAYYNSEISSKPHLGRSTEKVKLLEAKAKIERQVDGTGRVTIAGKAGD